MLEQPKHHLVIKWDKVFGTYNSGKEVDVALLGAGLGDARQKRW